MITKAIALIAIVAMSAQAVGEEYICSATISNPKSTMPHEQNKPDEVTFANDVTIQIDQVGRDVNDWGSKVEAFAYAEVEIQSKLRQPVFLIARTYMRDMGGAKVPELSVGVYSYYKNNKNTPYDPIAVHTASGDARSFATLDTRLSHAGARLIFTCRHKDYL